MAWQVAYDGSALPTASSPAWSKTASSAPAIESVAAGILSMKSALNATFNYTVSESSPSNYSLAIAEALLKIDATHSDTGNGCALLMYVKGQGRAFINVKNSTTVTTNTYNGSTFTSTDYTIPYSCITYYTRLKIIFDSGVTTFYVNDELIHTYSGTQETGQTANSVVFGDFASGATGTSYSYWDSVSIDYGALSLGTTKSTLSPLLKGEEATANIRVFQATDGHAYRIYDAAGTVLASSGTVSGGTATLTPTMPATGYCYIQGFTDNTYTSTVAGQRYPSSGVAKMQLGNVLCADLSLIGTNPDSTGLFVVDMEASYYYSTSQYGSQSQIVETEDYRFITWAAHGGGNVYDTGAYAYPAQKYRRYRVARYNKSTGLIDQGPYAIGPANTFGNRIEDGHEGFSLQRNPVDGKLRFVFGSQGGVALSMIQSTNADDVSAWGSTTALVTVATTPPASALPAFAFTYAIDSSGNNYIAGGAVSGGDIWFGYSTNATPTTVTWTKVMSKNAPWGALFGDMVIDESGVSPVAKLCWGMYNTGGAAATAYRYAYYIESDDQFATAAKADGTSVTLPVTTNATTGATTADEISTGYHYGYWHKIADSSGTPYVLLDNSRDALTDPQTIRHWNGSAWASADLTELPMWVDDSGTIRNANWGVLLTENAGTVYVYACKGYPVATSLDTANGMSLIRFQSDDAYATYTVDTFIDDSFAEFSYTELDDDTDRPAGTASSGFAYPKVADGYPDTIMFSIVDRYQATVALADPGTYVAPGSGSVVQRTLLGVG